MPSVATSPSCMLVALNLQSCFTAAPALHSKSSSILLGLCTRVVSLAFTNLAFKFEFKIRLDSGFSLFLGWEESRRSKDFCFSGKDFVPFSPLRALCNKSHLKPKKSTICSDSYFTIGLLQKATGRIALH